MEDETGSGALEFKKMTPEIHVQQLLIDLHNANEENKQLRKSVNSLSSVKDTSSAFGFGIIMGAIIFGPVWVTLYKAFFK